MTRERLIEAITAHSPDGAEAALQRVRQAAKKRDLNKRSLCYCLLAVAWQASVDALICYREGHLPHGHGCSGVVRWFDGFKSDFHANAAVLALLDDGETTR